MKNNNCVILPTLLRSFVFSAALISPLASVAAADGAATEEQQVAAPVAGLSPGSPGASAILAESFSLSAAPAAPDPTKVITYFERPDGTITFDRGGETDRAVIAILPASDQRVIGYEGSDAFASKILEAREKRTSRNLEIAFHALNAVDAIETIAFLKKGTAREMNPVYGANPSPVTLVATKVMASGLFHLALNGLRKEQPSLVKPVQYFSVAFMGGLVAWNAQFVF